MDFHVTRSEGLARKLLIDLLNDTEQGPWYVTLDYTNTVQPYFHSVTGYLVLVKHEKYDDDPEYLGVALCDASRIDLGETVTVRLSSIMSVTVPC